MTIQTSTLRPGLLVSLKTSVSGNVSYRQKMLDSARIVKGKTQKARWETERTVADVEEHDAAIRIRSAVRMKIGSVCANSAFGLLCPETNADRLEEAIKEARELADGFNATAKLTRLNVYVITGRISPDDVEAVKAIKSEVRELLNEMKAGVENMDPKAIRDAASRARSVGAMLSPEVQARVTLAIEAARSAAKKLVAAGETAAREVDKGAIRQILESRTAFLDLDDNGNTVTTPEATAPAVDFAPAKGKRKAQDGYQPEARDLEV